jgi:hypothetical protein
VFNLQAKLAQLKLSDLRSAGFCLVALGYEADAPEKPVLFAYKNEPTKADLSDKTAIMSVTEAEDILADVFDSLPPVVIPSYPRLLQTL